MDEGKELLKQGWTRASTYDEPRLSEMKEVYLDIGFEVRVLPYAPEGKPTCESCIKADPGKLFTIYTRKRR